MSFVAGGLCLALPLSRIPWPPAAWIAGSLAVVVGVAPLLRAGLPGERLLAGLVLLATGLAGFGYAHWRISLVLDQRLPLCADADFRTFRLSVEGVPDYRTLPGAGEAPPRRVARFHARVQVQEDPACAGLSSHRVRLSWYDPPLLEPGALWLVEGRLRPPWGFRNPGGFDYERWLLGQGLHGTGYVRSGRLLRPGEGAPGRRSALRLALTDWVAAQDIRHPALVLALMVGDDSGISSEQWQVLRASGTIHLLVVSGLHVGLIAGLTYLLGLWLARCFPALLARYGAHRPAGVLSLLAAGAYVWLCGFGVPASRAWLMTSLVLAAFLSGRALPPWRVFGVALAAVLLADPLVVHQQGFWLSFGAVGVLLAHFGPRSFHGHGPGPWRVVAQYLQVQLVLFVAMAPMLASVQPSVPVVSPLVNLLAVPLISLAVLPLLLAVVPLQAMLPEVAAVLLVAADGLLDLLMTGAAEGAAIPGRAMGLRGVSEYVLMFVLLWLLSGAPAWPAGLMLLALWWALLLPDGGRPSPGQFRVTALDVGQGSAILVDTHRHRLIFDTGPAFPSGFDLGSAAVVPSFQSHGEQRLDALVLSHDDLDHTGGADAVVAALAPARIWASFEWMPAAGRTVPDQRRCGRGVAWEWDGVRFRFLHPTPGSAGTDNDRSCVLLLEGASASALLAGDITARVERTLEKRPVDLLMAPHHGSGTSSSMSFVRGYRPKIVLVSTERRSRYGHPHPRVLERYAAASVYVTGRDGALRWESHRPAVVQRMRRHGASYWHSD